MINPSFINPYKDLTSDLQHLTTEIKSLAAVGKDIKPSYNAETHTFEEPPKSLMDTAKLIDSFFLSSNVKRITQAGFRTYMSLKSERFTAKATAKTLNDIGSRLIEDLSKLDNISKEEVSSQTLTSLKKEITELKLAAKEAEKAV